METIKAKARFAEPGTFAFAGNGDDGFSRPWQQRLCPLDVPLAACPSGLDPQFKYGVTSAAVRQAGHLILNKPVRASQDLRSHRDYVMYADGKVSREFSPSVGVHTWEEVRHEDDTDYWFVGGYWWPDEHPKLAQRAGAGDATLGGSWEMTFKVDTHPDDDGVRWIREITGVKGSAILERDAAAAGEESLLIAASAADALEHFSGEARAAFLSAYQVQDAATAMASLPLASIDFTFNLDAARERLLNWAANDDGTIDPSRARLVFLLQQGDGTAASAWACPVADIFDDHPRLVYAAVNKCCLALRDVFDGTGFGYLTNTQKDQLLATCRRLLARWYETDVAYAAAAGQGGNPDMGDTADLATLTATAELNGELVAQVKTLTVERDAYAEALQGTGAESIAALASARDEATARATAAETELTAIKSALAEAGVETVAELLERIAEAQAQAEKSEAERIEAEASAWMTANAERYPAASHEVVKAGYIATLKGEALTVEQVTAIASGSAPTKAPEGNDDEVEPATAEAGADEPNEHERIYRELEAELPTRFGGSRTLMAQELNRRLAAIGKEG